MSRAGFALQPSTTALKGMETPLTLFIFPYLYTAKTGMKSRKGKLAKE